MKTKEFIIKSWLVALLEVALLPIGTILIAFVIEQIFSSHGGTDSSPISPGTFEGLLFILLWITLWFIGIISSIKLGRNSLLISSSKKALLIAVLLIAVPIIISILQLIYHNYF